MKIAFFLEFFPKVSETFILYQIISLLNKGHQVDIYARHNPKEKVVHKDVKKYKLLNKTFYFAEPSNIFKRLIRASLSIIRNFHKNPKLIFKAINFLNYEKEIPILRKLNLSIERGILIGALLNNEYDIIHCHFGNIGKLGAFLKRIGIKGKLVTTFYGNDITQIIKQHGTNYYKVLFNYGDLFLPICDYFKKLLVRMGCNKEKIILHPVGINIGRLLSSDGFTDPESIRHKVADKVNIFSVGRFIEKKGIEYSIRAFSNLVDEYKNIRYLIGGDGPLRKSLESLVLELRIEDKITFLGYLEYNELLKVYKKAHIFVLTSVTAKDGDMEGTPVVLLEAQLMSLPVISTFHSGIPEIILNGRSGYLVPERDISAIEESLRLLIANPEKLKEMGECGSKFIKTKFDAKILNEKLISYYEKLLL